jgi:hypothetical protein
MTVKQWHEQLESCLANEGLEVETLAHDELTKQFSIRFRKKPCDISTLSVKERTQKIEELQDQIAVLQAGRHRAGPAVPRE